MDEAVDKSMARVEISRNVELAHKFNGGMRSLSGAGRCRCGKKIRVMEMLNVEDRRSILQEKRGR